MTNMSYCRFRNTLQDLRDCVNYLDDDFNDISSEEKQAAKRMRDLCKQYIAEYDDLIIDGE